MSTRTALLRLALLLALLLRLAPPARAAAPPAPPVLPPAVALGGECRLLVSCPWSGPLAAHFRLGGYVWLGQAGDPRPVSVVPFAALSASLWRWAEAGAMFTGRGGAAQDGGPALLQLPITLWARLSPQLGTASGFQAAAELRYAIGNPPFDAAGTVAHDTQSYALSVGYQKSRVEVFATGAYQEAAARSYRGLEAGGGIYVLALRALGLQLGAEALGRFGGSAEGGASAGWTAAAVLRFVDEHGVSGTLGAGTGDGAGMPGRMSLGFVFGLSFGPAYRPHPTEPGFVPLGEAIEGWLRDRWARRHDARLPPLGPPRGLPPLLGAAAPGALLPPLGKAPGLAPAFCERLAGLPARAVGLALQRGCLGAFDTRLGGPLAQSLGGGQAAPAALPFGPPALAAPLGPPRPGTIAGGGPARTGAPRTGAPGRGGLRTGRGTGWSDPDTQAPQPGELPPVVWTGRGPASPSIGLEDAPRPPPSIPLRPQPPAALPPGASPASVPPFLRPLPGQRGVADHGLAPMAPLPPRPYPPAPAPAPAEAPAEPPAPAPAARRGSARAAAIEAALPPPAVQAGPPFPRSTRTDIINAAPTRGGQVICAECGVPTKTPEADHMIPRARGGSALRGNGEALCPGCNRQKSDKPTVPWKLAPVDRRMPFVPRRGSP